MIWTPLQYVDLAGLYHAAPGLWDALILLTIFLGISIPVFTKTNKHFGKRHGKILAVGISIALTLSVAMWQARTGVYIGGSELSILPLTIIFLIFYYLLYKVLEDIVGMKQTCALSLAYIITYSGLDAMFGYATQTISAQQPLVGAFIRILLLVAVIALISCIVMLISGLKWPKGDGEDEEPNERDSKKQRETKKEKQKQPPDTKGLQQSISDFQQLIQLYLTQIKEFAKHANMILKARTHNSDTSKYEAALAQTAADLDDTAAKIRSVADGINRHKQLTQLPEEAVRAYLDAFTNYYNLSMRLEQYWNKFQHAFRNRQAPTEDMQL